MRVGYFLLFGFAFILGATCAFTGFRQYPIPPQDIDFRLMRKAQQSDGLCGVVDPFENVRQKAGFAEGEVLFKSQCAQCHHRNMHDDLTGPALGNIKKNWAAYPREDLYEWIRNSQKMINEGHPRAVNLWKDWQPTVMNNFNLTDKEIEYILNYIDIVDEATW